MLGRTVLIAVQFAIGWRLVPEFAKVAPDLGDLTIFIYAIAFSLLVWLIGILGHLVLKDVAQPTPSTLLVAMVFATAFAAAALVPDVAKAIAGVIDLDPLLYPLAGAVLGYAVK